MNYYTLQIHYRSTHDPDIEERRDMTPGAMNENEWIKAIRENIWKAGFTLCTAPGCYEFINPLVIVRVFLIKQDKKYSL